MANCIIIVIMAVAHIKKCAVKVFEFFDHIIILTPSGPGTELRKVKLNGFEILSVQPLSPLQLNLSYMYICNPSYRAVQLHLQYLYCARVHLGWTQTAPLGAFMPTTMWLS